jgi:cyclase
MLAKRIIPCLDIKNGRTVKGVNFVGLKDAGDPVELAVRYSKEGADELCFLDITATLEGRSTFVDLVKEIAKEINIPFTVGGGISSVEEVEELLKSGADKVSINSSAVRRPELITEIASVFGAQCTVVGVDGKLVNGQWLVHTHGGTKATELKVIDWCLECERLGAGEILLTSMENDGTKNGFANDLLMEVNKVLSIPVIASGGAGTKEHFLETFVDGNSDAALAASVFHFKEIEIMDLKNYLRSNNIPMRC